MAEITIYLNGKGEQKHQDIVSGRKLLSKPTLQVPDFPNQTTQTHMPA